MLNNFRLTLTSAQPFADTASSSVLYWTPFNGNRVELWDGQRWTVKASNEISLNLASQGLTASTNYDVFVYFDSPSQRLELELDAWAANARVTELVRNDGVFVKASNNTRRYVGTMRTVTATTSTDSTSKRFLWNYSNRIERSLRVVDTTDTWTYAAPSGAWRLVNASTANCFEYVTGEVTSLVVTAHGLAIVGTAASTTRFASVGIGLFSSTNFNSAKIWGSNPQSTTLFTQLFAMYRGLSTVGYDKVNWLETGETAVTYTFAGDNNTSATTQTGMLGMIMG